MTKYLNSEKWWRVFSFFNFLVKTVCSWSAQTSRIPLSCRNGVVGRSRGESCSAEPESCGFWCCGTCWRVRWGSGVLLWMETCRNTKRKTLSVFDWMFKLAGFFMESGFSEWENSNLSIHFLYSSVFRTESGVMWTTRTTGSSEPPVWYLDDRMNLNIFSCIHSV